MRTGRTIEWSRSWQRELAEDVRVRMASHYRRRLAAEQDAASVYRALARQRHSEEREILLALARG